MASKQRNVLSKKSEEDLNANNSYRIAEIARYGFPYLPMCMCYDPLQSLLAIGTKTGCIRVLGRPGVDVLFQHEGDVAVVGLQFIINMGQLISATSDDHIHLWNLRDRQPSVIHSLKFQRDRITCLYMPFQSTWLYVGTDKGNVFMVNATSFQLSGYNIMWNKTMDLHQKHHPGFVTQIVENPSDQAKMLIGYETGLIVLWDLNKKCAEFHYKTSDVKHVSWHHEGKLFMSCHGDGSLSVWNAKSPNAPEKSWVPHIKETNGKQEPCQPITKVDWKSSRSSDSIIIFTGGLSADKGAIPSMTLTFSGDEVVTFKLDSPVIDFLSVCSTPFGNVVQEPVAVVVLMREEFVVVDLQTQNFLPFEPAYPFDIHESKVTSCYYLTNCSPDIVPMLYSITSKQKRRKYTDKEWPIKGGQWGSPVFSYSELIITGHEDGSVKFWDATGVTLLMLYKIKTSRLFEPDSANSPLDGATPTQPQAPPTFHSRSDNPNPYAVHHLSFCDESKLLCVAGLYHLILYKFNKTESSSECPVIDIHMVYQNFDDWPNIKLDQNAASGASSPDDEKQIVDQHIQVRTGVLNWPPGYKAEFCCSIGQCFGKQASPVVSVVLNSKYGLLAVGNETGMAVIDILTKTRLFAFACPDLYGSSDPFSRSPPPLVASSSADQLEDKKLHTPVSSISTENPNTLLNPIKPQESDDLLPKSPSSPLSSCIPSNPSNDSAPVAPPRRKKKEVSLLEETDGVRKTQEAKVAEVASPTSPAARVATPLSPGDGGNRAVVEKKDNSEQKVLKSDDKGRIEGEAGSSKGTDDKQLVPKEDVIEEVEKQKVMEKNAEAETMLEGNDMAEEEKRGEEQKVVKSASVEKTNSCHNHNICSCLHLSNNDRSAEDNLSKICCCLKTTDQVQLVSEESKLLPEGPGSSPCRSSEPKFPLRESTSATRPKNTNSVSTEAHVNSRACPPSLRQSSIVSSSPTIPSPSTNENLPSWKIKFNRFRSTFLNAITALTAAPPSTSIQSKAKFEVIDMSNDVSVVVKETNYSAYAKKCQGDLSGGEGSTSDEENVKESILEFVFMESFPHKNEATCIPCIWVGTSLGSVIVLSAENPGGGPNQDPVVAPTGTIFRLKGRIVNISFLDSNCSNILKSPVVSWKNFGKDPRECTEVKPSEGVPVSENMQHVVLTSEKQIRLIGLPSMTCLQKFKVTDDNHIVKAKAVLLKNSLCLLTRHVNGNITIFELPSLKVVQDLSYVAGRHPRLSKTFQFSNFGQGVVMVFPSEIQKFAITKGNEDQLPDVDRQLFTVCEVPEPPKVGFFQSFFDSQQVKLNREALFGESGSGKPSKMLTTYVPKMDRTRGAAVGAASEIARAKLAALERGEKLGELEEKSERMKMNAESFGQMASQVKNKYKNKKWYQF